MNTPLEDIANKIGKDGLPTADVMRAQIAENEAAREIRLAEIKTINSAYTILFNRFKNGEKLTDEEIKKMSEMSDIIEQFNNDNPDN